MNLILIFNKIESHTNFNGRGKIKPCVHMGGFGESNCFIRVLPEHSIKECVFSSNDKNLNQVSVDHTEILLIQLSENINSWNEDFKNDFISYALNFENIYISYHKGPNNGDDIKNGKHRLVEDILEGKNIISTDRHHHDFYMHDEEQLYGVLAQAIVDNQGVFTKENYDDLTDKMVRSILENKEINEVSSLNQKLTFLHKLLGNELNDKEIKENLKEFNCSISFNSDDKNASIITIKNAILKP